jgi:MSHA pilin protein MshD
VQRQRGVTLIELVMAVTIVAMAATAVLGAMSSITKRGADVMLQQQAVAVAEAYLEEILLKPVADPGGTVTTRSTYDKVDDYNGLSDAGAHDQFGNAISYLGGYNVAVAVAQSSAFGGLPAAATRRIDITVTTPTGQNVRLTGYRASY